VWVGGKQKETEAAVETAASGFVHSCRDMVCERAAAAAPRNAAVPLDLSLPPTGSLGGSFSACAVNESNQCWEV